MSIRAECPVSAALNSVCVRNFSLGARLGPTVGNGNSCGPSCVEGLRLCDAPGKEYSVPSSIGSSAFVMFTIRWDVFRR